jgi:hypothetical protein
MSRHVKENHDRNLRRIIQSHSVLQAKNSIITDMITEIRAEIADEIHELARELSSMSDPDDPYDGGHADGLETAERFARYGTLYPEEKDNDS